MSLYGTTVVARQGPDLVTLLVVYYDIIVQRVRT